MARCEVCGNEYDKTMEITVAGHKQAATGLTRHLLSEGFDATRIGLVEADLRRLLDGVRRRPQVVALAQAQTQEASLESTGSVGLRLAYQLERVLDAQVIVAATEALGESPPDATLGSALAADVLRTRT